MTNSISRHDREQPNPASRSRSESDPSRSTARGPRLPLAFLLGWIVVILFLLPTVSLAILAFDVDVDYLPRLWRRIITLYAVDTIGLLVGTAIGAGLLGSIIAVGTTVLSFPGRRFVLFLSFMPIAIPAYLVAYMYGDLLEYAGPVQSALRDTFGWTSKRDYWFPEIKSLGGGIIVFSVLLFPYVLVAMRAALRSQLGLVSEVGRTSGRGLGYSILHIGVPLLWPAAFAGMLLASLEAVGDFGLVEYFGIDTLTFALFDMWLNKSRLWAAALIGLLLLATVGGVVWLERRLRRRTDRMSSGSFSRPPKAKEIHGVAGILVAIVLAIPAILGFVLPVLWLVISLAQSTLLSIEAGAATAALPWREIWTTFYIGLIAALVVPTFVMLLQWRETHGQWNAHLGAHARYGRGSPFHLISSALPMGYAIPGLVLAFTIGWSLRGFDNFSIPFQQALGIGPHKILGTTIIMVTYAYVIRFSAPASAAIRPGLTRVTPSLVAASRIMGQNRWQRFTMVYTPMLSMPYFLGALIVFVEVAKELPIMLFLRDTSINTLAAYSYDFGSEGLIAQAAPAALLIIALGVVPAAIIASSQAGSKSGVRR